MFITDFRINKGRYLLGLLLVLLAVIVYLLDFGKETIRSKTFSIKLPGNMSVSRYTYTPKTDIEQLFLTITSGNFIIATLSLSSSREPLNVHYDYDSDRKETEVNFKGQKVKKISGFQQGEGNLSYVEEMEFPMGNRYIFTTISDYSGGKHTYNLENLLSNMDFFVNAERTDNKMTDHLEQKENNYQFDDFAIEIPKPWTLGSYNYHGGKSISKSFTFEKSDNLKDSFTVSLMNGQFSRESQIDKDWDPILISNHQAYKTVPHQDEGAGSLQFIILNTQDTGYYFGYSRALDESEEFWKIIQTIKVKE